MSWFSGVTSWWTGEPAAPAEPVLREEEKDEMIPEEPWVKALQYTSVMKRGDPEDIHKEPKEIILEPHAKKFVLRSKDYLETHIKVNSGPSLLRLAGSDLILEKGVRKLSHVSEFPETLPMLHPERRFLVINWQLPASPPFSFVVTYVFPNEEERAEMRSKMTEEERAIEENAWNLLEKFVSDDPEVDEKWRNSRFKLIPQIVEGPWYVRTVTPSNVPALICNKLATTYIRGPNYFELDIDITTSLTANTIWSVVSGVTASLVIDLAWVIQGNTIEELPEQILGTIRLSRIVLSPDLVRVVTRPPKPEDEKKEGEAAADGKPAEEKPAEEKPAEEKPAEEKPAEEKPAEEKPAEEKPAEEKPAEEKPAEEKPAEEKPAEEKPAEEKPAEEKPAEEKPAEEKPAEEKPAEEKPAEEKPAEEKPAEEKPAEEKPAEEKPAEEKPAEEKPAEEKPAEEKPAEEKPAEEKPAEEKPAEEKPAEEKPTEAQ